MRRKLVDFNGTYQHVETTNAVEILKVAGNEITDETLAKINDTNTKLSVFVYAREYRFATNGIGLLPNTKFTIGDSVQESLADGTTIKTTVTKEEDKIILSSHNSETIFRRIFEFTDVDVTMTLITESGMHAKRIFRRITTGHH